ncbi:MAG: hypothetical protein HN650_16875, partial [Rhodospirillaceae bacterium]|nr:hypothetical protein [Rhodospirillaceae bacterium]
MSNDLCERDLSWVAAAITDKTISAEEATRAAIARLETVGPTLHAVQAMDPDLAIDAARQADVKLARGQELGPLHGVPLAHKDMFYRKGRISGCGS